MKKETCGCCEGLRNITPMKTANRPGLGALAYRAGTHASFLETMKARLSSIYLDIPRDGVDANGRALTDRIYPLRHLTTRAGDDPSIALLDGWAMVGAVLTFYQERIANEGYLNTASERRSILELANLIGYELRPGVSASVFLAYTIDGNAKEPVVIPAGARTQSVPDPGEDPQTFETSDPLEARSAWNDLRPRRNRPQIKETILNGTDGRVYLKGTATNLKKNDPLLIDFGDGNKPQLFRIAEVEPDQTLDRTLVSLNDWQGAAKLNDGKFRAGVLGLVQRLQDTSGLQRSTAKTEMVGRVLAHLKTLEVQAKSAAGDADVALFLNNETLPHLEEELSVAESDVKYARVKAWLDPMVRELAAAGKGSKLIASSNALSAGAASVGVKSIDPVVGVLGKLMLPASVPHRNTLYLPRDLKTSFAARADTGAQLIATFQPALGRTLATALSRGKITPDNRVRVYALRTKAAPFGQAAPKKVLALNRDTGEITRVGEWPIVESETVIHETENVLFLDGSYDKIVADSWLVVDMEAVPDFSPQLVQVEPANRPLVITQVKAAQADLARAEYGISGKTTRLGLAEPWLRITPIKEEPPVFNLEAVVVTSKQGIYDRDFQALRATMVYAQSEELALAEEPINENVCGGAENWIELDGWYADLKSGRSLIVSGERTDITMPDPDHPGSTVPVTGVAAGELVMLAEVIQDRATEEGTPGGQQKDPSILPGETMHTFVKFAKDLAYCYKRDSVSIYGNVVKATHGETRREVLGSGDGGKALQSFTLRQPPLTYVASPNPSGVESTLKVFVNDLQWREVDSLAGLGPIDRQCITRTDDDAMTRVVFGNGKQGARLPTGLENVRVAYRSGIGKGGNVKSEQISLLMTRPLGVKGVINPLRASGGADKESRDQARKNAPLAVMALDRLVSVRDYADFTRTFAGIGKAAAKLLAVRNRELVHVTIAGADDIPIDTTSDLYRNLLLAIRGNGDPYQPFQVDLRELLLLVVSANVRIMADYTWDNVATRMRSTLLDTFSFERRDLGRDLFLSEVIGAMQAVAGVAYVDVDLLAAIPEKKADAGTRRLLTPDEITKSINDLLQKRESEQGLPDTEKSQPPSRIPVGPAAVDDGTVRPARLAILSPNVPDTLILNQIL